ncbi:MAG: hypothetical protein J7501_12790, partial [Bdellovibrio sp.]|nr:hypothetical protein [Bdellovibrio sp.]
MFKPALTFKSLISLTTASVFLFSSIAPAAQQVTQYATGKYAQKYSNYGVDMSPQSLNSYNYQTSVQTHNLTETEKTRLIKDKELMDKMGYDVRVDSNARTVTVLEKGTQNPVMEFPFSDPDRLRQYSPKSINQMLKNEMMKVKSAGKAALSHSTKNLPAESAVFFMAMGGVVATQLVSNYSQNPVAMKQHIEHSLSPMGVFGFYAFMSAQGITSNLLGMYLKNPAFHHMIPYLGMSVGMFAQNYLSQIMMNPNVMACAKVMMGNKVQNLLDGADKDPCNAAYEQLALGKVLWESAPMLVSMLTSSALAGGIQSLAAQGIAEASEKQAVKNLGSNIAKARLGAFMRASESTAAKAVLRVTGVDVATWILPGGMQVKGIRLLLVKGLQIAAFVQIDQWLNRSITYMWKNAFDGDELDNIATHVEENVNSLKRSQWKSDDTELQANMKLFKEKMAAWRMTNLAEVYESYSNWQDSITQLMSMYNASYSFYKDFIQQVRTERYGKNYAQPLERLSPLYGIKANLEENQKDFLLTDPAFIERQQFQTLQAVAQEAKELLKEENLRDLTTAQKQALKTIVSGMSSEEDQVLGRALLLLNSEIRTAAQNYSMQAYYKILWSIYTALGAPSPMMEKGRGWVTYYTQAPTSAEKIKGVSFYRKVGDFYTPNITDFFIMQMICGPDVERGDQAIKSSLGYPSVFMPPAIRNDKDQFDSCSSSRLSANGVASIYSIPVQSAGGNYSGFVSYLAAQARPSVVGDQATNSFDNWWQKNTESQMQAAFAQFSRSYEDI